VPFCIGKLVYSLHKQKFEKDEYNFLVFSEKVFVYFLHSISHFLNVIFNVVRIVKIEVCLTYCDHISEFTAGISRSPHLWHGTWCRSLASQ